MSKMATKMKDFDMVFSELDEFGRYQRFHLALLLLCNGLMNAFTVFGLVFLVYTPDFHCAKVENLTATGLLSGKQEVYQEFKFAPQQNPWLLTPINGTQTTTGSYKHDPCMCPTKQWVYSKRYMASTIVTEWNLVCDQSVQTKIMINCLYGANAIGCLALSLLQDKIGRKPSLSVFITLVVLGNVFAPAIPIFAVYAAMRAIANATAQTIFNNGYIWAIEFVGPSKRTLVSVIFFAFNGFAVTSIALIAYVFNSWKQLSLIFSVPFIAAYSYNWILSESPRWYIQKGRTADAIAVVKRIIRWQNQKPAVKAAISQKICVQLEVNEKSYTNDSQSCGGLQGKSARFQLLGLFRTPNLRYKSIIICLCYMISNITYIGLAFNSENLGGNLFIAFAAQAVMEIPAVMCNVFLLDRYGRMVPISGFFGLTGIICCLTAPASYYGLGWLVMTLCAMAKFCVCLTCAIVGQIEVELFPTELRATGMGLACFCGAAGNMIMPFIVYTSRIYIMLPMILLGVLSIVGGMLSIQLPETKNTILPETVEEAEVKGIAGIKTATETIIGLARSWRKEKLLSADKDDCGEAETAGLTDCISA